LTLEAAEDVRSGAEAARDHVSIVRLDDAVGYVSRTTSSRLRYATSEHAAALHHQTIRRRDA
jgi:hypothetical protein